MWKTDENSHANEVRYVDELPERDLGLKTSEEVVLQELKQMANEYSRSNLDIEVSRLKKLEDIYRLTDEAGAGQVLDEVYDYKTQINDRKKMFSNFLKTQGKLKGRKKGPLAITDGSGMDMLDGEGQNVDNNLKSMERRIIEAKRAIQAKGSDNDLLRSLQDYLDVFKQSLDSIDNISSKKPADPLKIESIQQLIERETGKSSAQPGVDDDAAVAKALDELKRLNDQKCFDLNPLPFTPGLPKSIKDFNEFDMYNDVLEDLGVKEDIVEVPIVKFLDKSAYYPKPAKSIMKKIEEREGKHRTIKPSRLRKKHSDTCH